MNTSRATPPIAGKVCGLLDPILAQGVSVTGVGQRGSRFVQIHCLNRDLELYPNQRSEHTMLSGINVHIFFDYYLLWGYSMQGTVRGATENKNWDLAS